MSLIKNNDKISASRIIKLRGIPVSSGIGYGRPCFSRISTTRLVQTEDSQSNVISKLTDAFKFLSNHLEQLAREAEERIDKNIAEIFYAHQLIIDDEAIQQVIMNKLTNSKISADEAIETCFDDYYSYFSKLNKQAQKDQAEIFSELKQLLLNLLHNANVQLYCKDYDGCKIGECILGNDHILITKQVDSNVILRIKEHTKGIIAESCGKNSHGAVVSRALGIPVVSGIKKIAEIILPGAKLLMNGDSGEIIIDPDESQLNKYLIEKEKSIDSVDPVSNLRVLADINQLPDIQNAIIAKAEGIGLYRTEFEILRAGRLLSEDEQVSLYKSVVENFHNKPVYIRLFDLGGDKSVPCIEFESEENPALGCRGARYLLKHPELVRGQARAIARISEQTPINVIYPMISNIQQFLELKNIFMDAIKDLNYGKISHGIMFEIPSACIEAELLFKEIDFGRIGSNDLVQYLFAYDRTDNNFNYEAIMQEPAIWRIIGDMIITANNAGKPLEICGEMVNIPNFIPGLIKLGITTVSTSPKNIAGVRKAALLNCHIVAKAKL